MRTLDCGTRHRKCVSRVEINGFWGEEKISAGILELRKEEKELNNLKIKFSRRKWLCYRG
jgi:hypothetical protein